MEKSGDRAPKVRHKKRRFGGLVSFIGKMRVRSSLQARTPQDARRAFAYESRGVKFVRFAFARAGGIAAKHRNLIFQT